MPDKRPPSCFTSRFELDGAAGARRQPVNQAIMKLVLPILLLFASQLSADTVVKIQMGDDCESVAKTLVEENIEFSGGEEEFILGMGYFVKGTPVVIRCLENTGVDSVVSISAFAERNSALRAYTKVYKKVVETLGDVDQRLMYMTLNPKYGEGPRPGEEVACWVRKYGVTALKVTNVKGKWFVSFETKPVLSC